MVVWPQWLLNQAFSKKIPEKRLPFIFRTIGGRSLLHSTFFRMKDILLLGSTVVQLTTYPINLITKIDPDQPLTVGCKSYRYILISQPVRKTVIAGNWKMYKTQVESLDFLQGFIKDLSEIPDERELVLCAPFTTLSVLAKNLHDSRIKVGAQNIHWAPSGAYTGEISGAMLIELGVRYVIVGHSERREHFGETDQTVNWRLKAAQENGLVPILCVGENKQQRLSGETETVITKQLELDLVDIDQQNLVIAYEPIWAIGTGETCECKEANRVIGLIRSQLNYADVPIQYGGSVKPNNIDEIMAQPEIDGALVGGASLNPKDFARIVNFKELH
jgi:triosephosphate isomerase (TIM)